MVDVVSILSTNPNFEGDEFRMSVFESLVQQLIGIKISHVFAKPGEAGFEGNQSWGYHIKAILPGGVFRSYVPPLKLAEGLKGALKAGGITNEKAVMCTDKGVWVDGVTMTQFIDSISKKGTPPIDQATALEVSRKAAELQGDLTVSADQTHHVVELDFNLPTTRAFMNFVAKADFSKDGRRI